MSGGIGTYHDVVSPVHRLPAGVKLVGTAVLVVAVVWFVRAPWTVPVASAFVVVLFAAARIPPRVAWAQLRPVVPMLVVIALFQLVLAGVDRAIVVTASLLLAIAVASVVTLTTRMSDMLDTVVRGLRPLRHVGVDPDRVGLVLILTVRCVPLVGSVVDRVSDARKARGLGFSLRAFVVPVIVACLRAADDLGEALEARGLDD